MTPKYFRASAASSSSMTPSSSPGLVFPPSTSECPRILEGAIRSRIICLISFGSGNLPSDFRSKSSSPSNSIDYREQNDRENVFSHKKVKLRLCRFLMFTQSTSSPLPLIHAAVVKTYKPSTLFGWFAGNQRDRLDLPATKSRQELLTKVGCP
jgi:hypothetical protein